MRHGGAVGPVSGQSRYAATRPFASARCGGKRLCTGRDGHTSAPARVSHHTGAFQTDSDSDQCTSWSSSSSGTSSTQFLGARTGNDSPGSRAISTSTPKATPSRVPHWQCQRSGDQGRLSDDVEGASTISRRQAQPRLGSDLRHLSGWIGGSPTWSRFDRRRRRRHAYVAVHVRPTTHCASARRRGTRRTSPS